MFMNPYSIHHVLWRVISAEPTRMMTRGGRFQISGISVENFSGRRKLVIEDRDDKKTKPVMRKRTRHCGDALSGRPPRLVGGVGPRASRWGQARSPGGKAETPVCLAGRERWSLGCSGRACIFNILETAPRKGPGRSRSRSRKRTIESRFAWRRGSSRVSGLTSPHICVLVRVRTLQGKEMHGPIRYLRGRGA